MLASLHIENIAVIKSLDIDFAQGFSAFTGETGAGKSIIMNSLDLLCGEKLRRDMIRTGEDNALVSALFTDIDERIEAVLSENGIPCQDGEKLTEGLCLRMFCAALCRCFSLFTVSIPHRRCLTLIIT